MWLPTPTHKDVEEFQALVKSELAIELPYEEAAKLANQVLLIYFYQVYGCRFIREKIDRK